MANNIRGITISLSAETTGLDKALQSVNKISREIGKELGQINKTLKFNPGHTEVLSQKQKVLGEQISTTRDKLKQLKDAEKEVQQQFKNGDISAEQYRAFRREIIETESKLKHYKSQVYETVKEQDKLGQAFTNAGESIKKFSGKVGDIGRSLSTKVTLPIIGMGTVATKSAIDFESAFTGVIKTVDATEEQIAGLKDGIKEMSKTIPASAVDISAVAEAAGQLGIEVPNIMDFTRTMVDLGEATNLSSEEAASSLAQFANITKMSQKDFDRLGSVIVGLGNNLATTEADIVNMGMRLAGAGSQVGLTEAQIMSFAGALSSVGIEAEAGGSAFSKVMIDMQLAVETNSERLQDFASVAGMSGEEFKKAFQDDAAGAIVAFIQGLGNAEEQGMSAIKVLDDMEIKEVRLRDALLRASGASDVFTESLELGSSSWEENTALAKEADLRYGTTESKLQILRNTMADMATSLGEILLPAVENISESLKGLTDKFSKLSPEQQENIVKIGLLVAAIGPALIIIEKLSFGLSLLFGVLGKIVTGVKLAGAAIGMITGPIGVAIAAIAAIVAIGVLLYKNWDTIKEKASDLFKSIKDIFGKIKDFLKGIFDFKWELPKLKMPKFEVTGKFSLSPPSVPKLGVNWNAKGGIFTQPTVLPTLAGLQGFGEAGPEAILPLNKLPQLLDLDKKQQPTINVTFQPQSMTDNEMDKAFNYINRRFGVQV